MRNAKHKAGQYFLFLAAWTILSPIGLSGPAIASDVVIRGKVTRVEGHLAAICRRLYLKRNDTGAVMIFRLPDTSPDQSIMSAALTALAIGADMEIDYDPAVTTGCGTEPKILFNTVIIGP